MSDPIEVTLKHPLAGLLRKPPLPLPGGEETPAPTLAPIQPGFLSPGQGERRPAGSARGCFDRDTRGVAR